MLYFFLLCLADGERRGKMNEMGGGGVLFFSSDFFLHSHDVFSREIKKRKTQRKKENRRKRRKNQIMLGSMYFNYVGIFSFMQFY